MSESNWLDELNAKIAREDAEDAARPDDPPGKRNITTFEGFASAGATAGTADDRHDALVGAAAKEILRSPICGLPG
jgi:hypothetical protein